MSAKTTTGLDIRAFSAWHQRNPPVVRDVSFTARAGRITALLGPNGAGKSTLLKALVGVVPSRGEVRLDGVTLHDLAPRVRAQRLAYVPQRSALRAPLNVQRVVELGRFAHRDGLRRLSTADRRAVSQALERTDTHRLADRRFTELSGGEQQRVLLARAIATGARTMLLDEPTSALDIQHSLRFRDVLFQLKSDGYTVLVVLHDLNEARAVADDAVLLHEGAVAHSGTVDQVISPGPIAAVYGVTLRERAALGFELGAE